MKNIELLSGAMSFEIKITLMWVSDKTTIHPKPSVDFTV